jgi:hypothetical protein
VVEDFLEGAVRGYDAMGFSRRDNPTQEYRHRWLDSLIEEFSA